MNKQILRLALPNIITNITVPLLGMVDIAIVGHIGNASHIGAIAIGTMIFNLIYWNFGFLRMGTSGLTAQAYGAEDWDETMRIMVRGLAIAVSVALLLILLQYPIARLCELWIDSSENVMRLAILYFHIRIWAAPATLGLYVLKGWFIGMQNSQTPMWIAIIMNIINIVFSLLFVIVWKMGITGVALGTVMAQYSGLLMAIALWFKQYGHFRSRIDLRGSLHIDAMKRFFKVNGDIFLRHFRFYGRPDTGCQHLAHAIIHLVFLHYGWLRLRRRVLGRKIHRSERRADVAEIRTLSATLGNDYNLIIYSYLLFLGRIYFSHTHQRPASD